MFSISYPADEHYITPNTGGVPVWENAKQFIASKRRLVNFYGFNSGSSDVYVQVLDSVNGAAPAAGDIARIYPVPAKGFISLGQHAGKRFERGIYAKAFTDVALTADAGAVMFWDVDWLAYS